MLILPLSTPSSGGLPPGVTSPGDGALNYVTGALTASRPSINVAQTWNNAAVPFDAFTVSVTNTASSGQSTVSRWLVDGLPVARILRDGYVIATAFTGNFEWAGLLDGAGSGNGLRLSSSNPIAWTSGNKFWNTADTFLFRDGPGILNQRNGTAAQTYRLERTYTDGSNRGYTDFAQDATGGARLNSVWTGSVAAPTNLLDVQGNGVTAASLSAAGQLRVASGVALGSSGATALFANGSFPYLSTAVGNVLRFEASGGINVASGGRISFSPNATSALVDGTIGIARNTSDALEVNNTTAGQFRDLRLRTLIASNGTNAAPGLVLGDPTSGWYSPNAGFDWTYSRAGAPMVALGFNMLRFSAEGRLAWTTSADPNGTVELSLYRGGPNTLSQRNGLNPQGYELFNSYTDPSNYERGFLRWSGSQLEIGADALGSGAQRSMAFKLGAATPLALSPTSATFTGDLVLANGFQFRFSAGTNIWCASAGNLILWDSAQTSFGRLQFGGVSSSYPALKRSAATLQARLADDSGFADFAMRDLYLGPAAVSGTITPTHTMTIYANGVAYKVPCVAA
jgi:hypothetical protein